VRLRRALRPAAGLGAEATLDAVLSAVDGFAAGVAQADDLTLVAIHRVA
jgi:hypothetical protein